jgi:tetratricopeptide (TPR) repeat protein
MNARFVSPLLCASLALFFFCQKDTGTNKPLVKVGMTVLTQEDENGFSRVSQSFPTAPAEFSIAMRPPVTGLIETWAIYKKQRLNPANLKISRSLDWKWKQRYMVSTAFMNDVLRQNLGYTDPELRKYYDAHKEEFKGPVVSDSAGKKPCTTMVVKPFEAEVKQQIVEKLFLKDIKPDSAFVASAQSKDTNEINSRWLRNMRNEGYRTVFLKKYFKEKYGKPYPDSLEDLVGKGKILSQDDMEVILSWIPADRRALIRKEKNSLADFAMWLMRWQLFSEKAKASGYASTPDIRSSLKWAWRFEIVQRYITDVLGPAAKKMSRIDTSMAQYSYLDEFGNPGATPDTTNLNGHFNRLISQQTSEHYDGLLYNIRRKAHVKFLTKEWTDERDKNPAALIHKADSLRDTGNTAEAEPLYRTLSTDFAFTPEGKKAIVELAKLQTEQQIYTEAIRNYRRVLLTDSDAGKRCNYMFMIGFIYDEYLDRPEMAEVNYKWVLKNAPDCELNDDAEFMMLHLGEQMSSVDELQAEVKRQGKKVEASEADTTALTVETEPAKEKEKEKK